jgi:hypothetical protein
LYALQAFADFRCPAIFSKTPTDFLLLRPPAAVQATLIAPFALFQRPSKKRQSLCQAEPTDCNARLTKSAFALNITSRAAAGLRTGPPPNSCRWISAPGSTTSSSRPESTTSVLQFPPTPERLLNSREVADWLGVSLDWVQAHARGKKTPRIPAVLLGTGRRGRQMLRFRREDVEKFILDHMQDPTSLRRRA